MLSLVACVSNICILHFLTAPHSLSIPILLVFIFPLLSFSLSLVSFHSFCLFHTHTPHSYHTSLWTTSVSSICIVTLQAGRDKTGRFHVSG